MTRTICGRPLQRGIGQIVEIHTRLSSRIDEYILFQLVSDEGRRQLRSATSRTCIVRRTYSNYGDRCFAVAGLKLWNSLPADL